VGADVVIALLLPQKLSIFSIAIALHLSIAGR
jgi:hypothetical protein